MRSKELSEDAIQKLQPLLTLSGTNDDKLNALKTLLSSSEIGMKGIEELNFVLSHCNELGLNSTVELDVSLARGLNYYTGSILEVKANDVQIGSITGGGRYDNLTGVFGMEGVSGVGISFGADRIFDVLNALDLYPANVTTSSRIMFANFGEKESLTSLKYINALRKAGIAAELYPEVSKMKKQMGYADAKKIPFVAIVGESELNDNNITLKDMTTGEQTKVVIDELINKVN